MSAAKETLKELLKSSGYSYTAARAAVFEALLGQEPLSMRELVERSQNIDRASVYRTVELFERLGIAQRLYTGWKYKIELTDKFSEHHHHVACTECGQTTPINETQLEAFIVSLAHEYGFTPTAHQIEIQGICGSCQPHVASATSVAEPRSAHDT